MKSEIQEIGNVVFPDNTGERIYMLPFTKKAGLPEHAKRWQATVDQMLIGIETDGEIYLMVDQGFVRSGVPQRRPGVHIDGNWIEDIRAHRGGDGGGGGHRVDGLTEELIILASDVAGCRAYVGEYEGFPVTGGDCSHIDISALQPIDLQPMRAYAGNVSMLHESIPVSRDCMRTLVRLNVPME